VSARRVLVLAEGYSADPHYGKTLRGVLRYRRDDVVGILDSTRAGETLDGLAIVGGVDEALTFRPNVALVGVATQGGTFPPAWRELLKACLRHGISIENGLHEFVTEDSELVELASRFGVTLTDLRRAPKGLNVPTGANLELPGRTVLTVGSDCAIGKMTVSLELEREARSRGLAAVFVPTGQTGIAISGWGVSVDAVVADFIAGAAERLVVEGVQRGGELLLVEGQGAITHPAYSGVTLGVHSCSATAQAMWRSRATPGTRSCRSRSSSTSTSAWGCPRGARSSRAWRSTRLTWTRLERGPRSPTRRRRRVSLQTTRSGSGLHDYSTQS
jgi:uncharacterized NAD-dependent epimerase/dehydratase family protein